MITDLTNSDNAGTVVDRINAAITEQDKGVSELGANPSAGTVISRVNAAIDAENNNELDDVTSSDNAGVFIGKVNDLFDSIRNGGGGEEPDPGPGPGPDPDYEPTADDYAYWNESNYIAFGDSITHTGWGGSWPPYLTERYCYLVAQELGMTLTNKGVSGSMMLYNGAYDYSREINSVRVETEQRSFAYELLNPDEAISIGNGVDARGPYGVDLTQYDLITLMFGGNDIDKIYRHQYYPNNYRFAEKGEVGDTNLDSFYGAYYRAVDYIVRNKRNDAILVICIEPKATGNYFNRNGELIELIMYIAELFSVPVVNFYDLEETIEIKNDGYGVHPTANGHIVMANYFKFRLGQIVHELNLRTE